MRTKQAYPVKSTSKYRRYSPTSMTNAFRAIREQHMPVARAALQYDVPETTLRQRALGRVNAETTGSGPAPTLTQHEEAVFVDHLKFMASVGYGYSRAEVVSMASEYAISLMKRDEDNPFSLKWFRGFMRRWPELSVKKPRALALARAKATSQEAVATYFAELKKILKDNNLMKKPQHIYNVDEKGLQTEHTPPSVIAAKGDKTPAVTSARSALTTVIGCGNALGTQIPPYFVFKGQRMREELLDDCTDGTAGTVTDSGWSNGRVFQQYLNDHFLEYVQGRDADQPILLLYDGHRSHISLELINWAREHNIILYVLPAHTSHVLQPLDVGCFGPFQRIYNAECHKFMRKTQTSVITRYNVCSLACKAYTPALSKENLKAAFRRSGIYPFNPSAVDSTQFKQATVFTEQCGVPPPVEADTDMPSDPDQDGQEVEPDQGRPEVESDQDRQEVEPDQDRQEVEPDQDRQPTALDHNRPATEENSNSISDFFEKKTICLQQKKAEQTNKRRNMSTIVSGRAITEESTVRKLEIYKANSTQKRKPNPISETMSAKRACSKPDKPKKGKTSMKQKSATDVNLPGPSGLQSIVVGDTSCESEDLTDDEEVCCVCQLFQPKEVTQCLSLVFTKWAQCDFAGCSHWTHLQYCCPQRVLRRGDVFICPCHHTEE